MADPLTVIGAVASTVQIIDVLTKAASALDALRVQWQSSDLALLSLESQLGALRAALTKIQEWIDSGISALHHQLIMDLDTALNCCKFLATRVDNEISNLQKAPGGSLLTTAKARFLFKRSGINELQNMIDRQTSTLTLLLTACNSHSPTQQQVILGASAVRKRMDRVKKDTESLRGTIDSSSFLSRSTQRSSKLSLLFDFDEQLFSSTPYSTMIRKTVKLSIRSPWKHGPGPDEVVTSITSDANGSVDPSRQLARHVPPQHQVQVQETPRIILLGQGEASKSTFLKQMMWMYDSGFSVDERNEWRAIIHDNIVTVMNELILSLQNGSIQSQVTNGSSHIDWEHLLSLLLSLRIGGPDDPLVVDNFKTFVETMMQTCISELQSFCSRNNLEYFAEHSARVFNSAYLPTNEDIFRARVRTTGIYNHVFDIPGHGLCQVSDVGGERAERKKWIHIFEDSPTVLLFVPLDCYDQFLYEDESVNRMQEGLTLIDSLINCRWFLQSKISICFTRHDVFETKIQSGLSPLRTHFPDFEGPSRDVIACRDYIVKKFADLPQHHDCVEVFYIDATNSEHVREVVDATLRRGVPTSERYHVVEKRADSLDLDTINSSE